MSQPPAHRLHPRVKSVKWRTGHVLEITFLNGKKGVVDFWPHIAGKGGLLKPLESVAFFKQVKVQPEFKTLVWPNDADWDPDILYWLATKTPIEWSTDPQH